MVVVLRAEAPVRPQSQKGGLETWTCQERPKNSSGCAVAGRALPSFLGKMMNMLTRLALVFVALVFLLIYTFVSVNSYD